MTLSSVAQRNMPSTEAAQENFSARNTHQGARLPKKISSISNSNHPTGMTQTRVMSTITGKFKTSPGGNQLRAAATSILKALRGKNGLAPVNNTFSDYTGREELGIFDKFLKFPASFTKSADHSFSLVDNIHEDTRGSRKIISATWEREITPHFQPTHPAEIASDNTVSQQFKLDITRGIYIVSLSSDADGYSYRFDGNSIGETFTPQAAQMISTIAHQGHLADITVQLLSITPVNNNHYFVPKQGGVLEYRIINEGDICRITTKTQFELVNSNTNEHDRISDFHATIEQTTCLDAKSFDNGGNRILTYQALDKPSVQKISLTMMLPERASEQHTAQAPNRSIFSRIKNQ